jgi:O-antigen/teichoic acid export membrane protein
MLTTVPTYVALSSFGFGTAAAIDMTKNYVQKDFDEALRTFQSVWVLVSAVLLAVGLLDLLGWIFRFQLVALIPNFHVTTDVLNAAFILVAYSAIAVQMNYFTAGYQGTRRYAEGTFLYDLTTPVETVALIAACLLNGGMTSAALAMLAVRVVATFAYYMRLLHYEPWMKVGWSHASTETIKRLVHPAFASLSMTLSTALSLQGLILSLGFFVSPAATAIFATARMITRIPLQVVGLTSRATLPEMTAAFSTGDKALSARLIILNLGFTAAISVPFTLALIGIGPYMLEVLSRHRLHAGTELFVWLALIALFQAIWSVFAQFLFAINLPHKFAYHYLVLAAVTAAAPILVGHTETITRSAIVWCAAEAIMLAIVYRAWRAESDLDYREFVDGASRFVSDGKVLLQQMFDRPGTR